MNTERPDPPIEHLIEDYATDNHVSQNTHPSFFSELHRRIRSFVDRVFKNTSHQKIPSDEASTIRSSDQQVSGKSSFESSPAFKRLDLEDGSQIIHNPETGTIYRLVKAPPITNLVISGGGAKGILLPGVIAAFETSGFREQLNNIAGSSIGAITGSFVAAGMTADEIKEFFQNAKFEDLLGQGIGPIHKPGTELLETIREKLATSVISRLNELSFKTDTNIREAIKNYWDKEKREHSNNDLNQTEEKINTILTALNDTDPKKKRLTFGMLHDLHAFAPKIFKDLTVTALCRENGKTAYFNAVKTPELDIGLAVRASSSLPVILKPVKIETELLPPEFAAIKPGKHRFSFVDGGYFDNIPVSVFENTPNGIPNLQTLVLVFDSIPRKKNEQSPFHEHVIKKHGLYDSSNWKEIITRDVIAKIFSRIHSWKRNTKAKEAGMEKIRTSYTQRSIPLATDLDTTDFDEAQKNSGKYFKNGHKVAENYLKSHTDEIYLKEYPSFEKLIDEIADEGLLTDHLKDWINSS